ncbi:unnamed protein product [Prunus armeniaca]|uniref:Uncharacterized protein n=1 Tax=Prunus armeniaca TaxID=36596 RepID=A0A6J5VYB6_PRUAR|nr:unnamed protein product [Prunus armeniaca]
MERMEESSRSHSNLEMSEENDEVEIGETGLENTMSPEETTQEPKVNMIFNTADEELDYYKKICKSSRFPNEEEIIEERRLWGVEICDFIMFLIRDPTKYCKQCPKAISKHKMQLQGSI